MSEKIANLFAFVEGDLVKSLGAIGHDFEGDDKQMSEFLKTHVIPDSKQVIRCSLPLERIKISLDVDAQNGLPNKIFSYLRRTGNGLWIFEDLLKEIEAPQNPFVCITVVLDGIPQVDATTAANPTDAPVIISKNSAGNTHWIDWLAAYTEGTKFRFDELLADDFINAIKLLFEHKHYISASKLIVSFIDTIAFLEFGDSAGNFERWLTIYFDLSKVGITAAEFWEFRNAILHTTTQLSRKVLSGKILPLQFSINSNKCASIDHETGAKVFSFELMYDALIQGIEKWMTSYKGNLTKQLEFINRYDDIGSDVRLTKRYSAVEVLKSD